VRSFLYVRSWIASLDQDSGVALLDEKSILGAIEEEKLNRSLGVGNVPSLAMARILEQHGIRPADITLAAVATSRASACRIRPRLEIFRQSASALSRDLRKSTSIPQLRQHLDSRREAPSANNEHHFVPTPPVSFYTSDLIAP